MGLGYFIAWEWKDNNYGNQLDTWVLQADR